MDKFHLVITGRRNTGKSSIINCILGQNKAIVSAIAGTTTDPVKKSFEIPGVASVVLIDTAGTDDTGELGHLRIAKTFETLKQADAALLVFTGNDFGSYEERLAREFQTRNQPFLLVHNKSDESPLQPALREKLKKKYQTGILDFSVLRDTSRNLIPAISGLIRIPGDNSLLGGRIMQGQIVLLVTPIDSEAPTGRMILPQVQMLRDALDHHCICIIVQPDELPEVMKRPAFLPDLVITDSQAFAAVSAQIPETIPLTSFSIVLARHKGNFGHYLQGTRQIASLHDGDRILILESCSHHVSCEDIGRVKIPALLRKSTGKKLDFDFVAGLDSIGRPFTDYALIIQCGGCMVTRTQLRHRLQPAIDAGIPVSNYGMVIAWTLGIFERAVAFFAEDTARQA